MSTATWLEPTAEASSTPEARGLRRDEVRMLVATPDRLAHARVRELADHLHPGDLLVVNTSATLPAAVPISHQRSGQLLHDSTQLDDGSRLV